jgi:hypothetical protein
MNLSARYPSTNTRIHRKDAKITKKHEKQLKNTLEDLEKPEPMQLQEPACP